VPGSQAQLTVCNAGTVDAPQWRLVAWQDLGSGSAALRSSASAEPSAWGDIKALYIGAVFQREQVLSGLELSYNQRNITRLVELLDDNFTFFFSPGDVGGSIPEQWGRVEEATATSRLLDRYLNDPNYPTCLFLQIDIKIEDGVQWVDVIPEDFPDEIWHTTTVEYASAFLIYPDVVYISARGSLAQFTIRNTGTGDAPEWRLVEWRDLGSNSVAVRAAVAGATWGSIKALYR